MKIFSKKPVDSKDTDKRLGPSFSNYSIAVFKTSLYVRDFQVNPVQLGIKWISMQILFLLFY